MDYKFPLRYVPLAAAMSLTSVAVQAELKELGDQEMRSVTGGSALQYSATDISYELSQLTGVHYDSDNDHARSELRTETEQVDATVHRLQINGDGEFHAHFDKLVLGDYGGANNSIYKDENGQGLPDVDLSDFGFGTSADNPFYFEDPYIEVQKQRHADGSESIRGLRIGFGNVRGTTPITINSLSGYIPTTSLIPDLGGGMVKAMVYGSGTKDTFVALLDGEPPDGTGNYPQTPEAGTGGFIGIGGTPDNVQDSVVALQRKSGGKELNLGHVRSLDYNDVKNFYISLTQGGGGPVATADGTVNGAMWSQHLNGVIPESRPDLPGWNMVIPYNDPTDASAGALEAHVDMLPALGQMLTGIGDDNPRQSYQPVF